VLVPVYLLGGESHIVFTKRTEHLKHHKGEICFPGGAFILDDGDVATTALRETYEEIGVLPEDVEIIGRLDDLVTISDFRVTPFVGVIERSPYPFSANPFEVQTIIEVPVAHLLDKANFAWVRRMRRGREEDVPGYVYGEHTIWGATAQVLGRLLDLLEATA
jgi:8-oxo-dGTP pyrophosphatase MutT (NUDIX family)